MKAKEVEKQVTEQVVGWFEAHGWRSTRHQSGLAAFGNRIVPIGEPGMPDYSFLFYLDAGVTLTVWCEMKRPDARDECRCEGRKRGLCTSCAQLKWRRDEMIRSNGRAVILRAIGIDLVVYQATHIKGDEGRFMPHDFPTLRYWYERQYGWLAEQVKGQMRLVG